MNDPGSREHATLLFLLALVLFASPLIGWWTTFALPWYAMFVPWALVIGLAALASRGEDRRR